MSEIFVSYLIINGISYTYTAMYIFNTLLFYSEINHKLSYIFVRTAPSKREIKHTLNYLNTSAEIIGTSYSVYNSKNIAGNKKIYNKKQEKKISVSNNSKPKQKMRRFHYIRSLYDLIVINREKRREKRRERLQRKMDKYKSELEAKHDGEEEQKMKQLGYTRCKYCKHYMAPDKLLEAISSAVIKLANEQKKYTPEQLSSIPTLIMNVGKREPVKAEQLDLFKPVLQRAVIKCSNCDDVLIDHISIDFVLELQQKQIDLIFENRAAIEFMHDISN